MKKLIIVFFLVLATAVWAGDFEDGSAAYLEGDTTTAASLFKKGAEQGDSYAQYFLALLYRKGDGV